MYILNVNIKCGKISYEENDVIQSCLLYVHLNYVSIRDNVCILKRIGDKLAIMSAISIREKKTWTWASIKGKKHSW